jgi:hypothetical protein
MELFVILDLLKQDWLSWWFGFFQVSIVNASCSIVDRFDLSTCHVASGAGDLLQFHECPTLVMWVSYV